MPAISLRPFLGTIICSLLLACSDSDSPATAASTGVTATGENSENCLNSDLVLHNTLVYTSNDRQWTAEAVAVAGDRIVYVGDNAGVQNYLCGSARQLDLSGSVVYAGFTDSHQHLEGVGRREKTLSLFGIPTLAETVAAIAEFAAGVPAGW